MSKHAWRWLFAGVFCCGAYTTGCDIILGIEPLTGDGESGGAGGGGSTQTTGTGGSTPATLVVESASAIYRVTVDSQYIWWVDNTNTIWRAEPTGANPKSITTESSTVWGIASNGNDVAWTTDTTVRRADVNGTIIKDVATGQASPRGIAIDTFNIFWVNSGSGTADDGEVKQAIIGGAVFDPPLANFQAQPKAIVESGTQVFWTNRGEVSGAGFGSVQVAAKDVGGKNDVDLGLDFPNGIMMGKFLTWTVGGKSAGEGKIRAKIDDTKTADLAIGLTEPIDLAKVPGTDFFYVLLYDGDIASVPDAGGAANFVAKTDKSSDIAANENGLYWTAAAGIYRLKP
ncbi:MAG: hypothetical protein IPK82_25585 [Polyangiaceae bacterium]|nr:hypothetical protein [Polyangiaceae bacterium]